MNRRCVPLLVAASLLSAPVASQHDVRCIVLVHAGACDIVPNVPLVASLLDEPGCFEGLTAALGSRPARVDWKVEMPAAHQGGTFQIHVQSRVSGLPDDWTPAREDALNAAIRAHLQSRLDAMLYAEPLARLLDRQAAATATIERLAADRRDLLARSAGVEPLAAAVARQQETLDQQLMAARVELATEKSAAVRLEEMQAAHSRRRDEASERHTQATQQLEALQRELSMFRSKLELGDLKGDALEALRADAARLEADIRSRREQQERTDQQMQDAQRMLTLVLEQIPPTAIALGRAEARLQGLMEERQGVAARRAELEERMQKAMAESLAAEQRGAEIAAADAQLTVVRGKLAWLEPVRCEVLRAR